MRIGVVEIGPATCQLLVADVSGGDGDTVMPTWAHGDRPGLEDGDGHRVLNTVGGLVSSASDAGAERIVAAVTSGHALAAPVADRVRTLFSIDAAVLGRAEAATLAVTGRRRRDAGTRPVAVHLGAEGVTVAADGAVLDLPCDLGRLRAALVSGGAGRLAAKRPVLAARVVRAAAAAVIARLVLLAAPRSLVMTGPGSPALGPGPIPVSALRALERDAPTVDGRLAAMVAAALAAELGEGAIAVDPAAVRAGILLREFREWCRARPARAGAQASW